MEQNKYDIALLQMTGATHEWLQKPRPCGDYIYATDRHILLRVRKSLCAGKYKTHDKQPKDIEKCMTKADTALLFDINAVAEVINKLEPTEVVFRCGDCGGDGEVLWTYEDLDGAEHTKRDECPVCNGSGKVTANASVDEQNIDINGDWFNVGQLKKILNTLHSLLNINSVTVEHIGDYRSMRIKVNEDIDALIMPNKTCRPTAKITLNPIKK